MKNSTWSKKHQPRSIEFQYFYSSSLVWWQIESCHFEQSDLLSPRFTSLHVPVCLCRLNVKRTQKQAILFWNQEMLFSSSDFFTFIISASQNIKNIKNQELSKANQLRCTYSETSMSIVFILLLTTYSLITSDYIFKETSMHCKQDKNISLQVHISSIWQKLGVPHSAKVLD